MLDPVLALADANSSLSYTEATRSLAPIPIGERDLPPQLPSPISR